MASAAACHTLHCGGFLILTPLLYIMTAFLPGKASFCSEKGTSLQVHFCSQEDWIDTHATAGCADTVDVGETSYASVLADDLDIDGRMDLILSTMNGNVYCFHTAAKYHPLKAWPKPVSFRLLLAACTCL